MLETCIAERRDALLEQLARYTYALSMLAHSTAVNGSLRPIFRRASSASMRGQPFSTAISASLIAGKWTLATASAHATPATRSALCETPFVHLTERDTWRHSERHRGDSGILASSTVTLADFDQVAVWIPHVATNLSR